MNERKFIQHVGVGSHIHGMVGGVVVAFFFFEVGVPDEIKYFFFVRLNFLDTLVKFFLVELVAID